MSTRATIDREGGSCLFPLPMTGETSDKLRRPALNPSQKPRPIRIEKLDKGELKETQIGQGFSILETLSAQTEDGHTHSWKEQWFVVQCHTYAGTQKKACLSRLEKAEAELERLKPKKNESAEQFRQRAEKILQHRKCKDLFHLHLQETITRKEKYVGRGRPKADSPRTSVEIREISFQFRRNTAAIDETLALAGRRIDVSNAAPHVTTMDQSIGYYREERLVERGFHRFKQGSLPTLPLYIRLPERIKGLMLLLTLALQAVTLIEFVARRNLAASQNKTISGLVPGNPKMKTARPTTERLLAPFEGLHLLIEQTPQRIRLRLVEDLNPLLTTILSLLELSPKIYDLSATLPKFNDYS